MKAIVKILFEIEASDDPAARQKFKKIAQALEPHIPADVSVRSFKLVEEGSGRQLDDRLKS